MEKTIEIADYLNGWDIYIADYTEDTEKIGPAEVFKKINGATEAMLFVNYPFTEGHTRIVKWKNDIRYIAEEICGLVQDIYETGEFGRANHGIEDLYLERFWAAKRGSYVVITAGIGS